MQTKKHLMASIMWFLRKIHRMSWTIRTANEPIVLITYETSRYIGLIRLYSQEFVYIPGEDIVLTA